MNLYTYCRNNPNVYVDPSGHSYGELPDGTKMSINSASDANKFNLKRDKQLVELSSKGLSTGRYNVANIVAAYKREQTRELIMAQINFNFDMTSKQSLDVNSSKNTTSSSGNNSFFGAEYSIVYNQSKEVILGSYGIFELKSTETNSYLIQKYGDSSCPISVFCNTSYNNLNLADNSCGIKFNYHNQCTTLYLGPSKIGIGLSYNNSCEMLNVINPTYEMMFGLSMSESSVFCNASTTYKISDIQSFSQSVEASVDYRYLALLYGLSSSGQYCSSEQMPNTSYNLAPIR